MRSSAVLVGSSGRMGLRGSTAASRPIVLACKLRAKPRPAGEGPPQSGEVLAVRKDLITSGLTGDIAEALIRNFAHHKASHEYLDLKLGLQEGRLTSKHDQLVAKQDIFAERFTSKQDQLVAKQDQLVAKQDQLVAKQDQLAAKQDQLGAKQDQLGAKLDLMQEQMSAKLDLMMERLTAKNEQLEGRFRLWFIVGLALGVAATAGSDSTLAKFLLAIFK